MTGKTTYEERRRLEAERHLEQERASARWRERQAEREAREERIERLAGRVLDALEAILDGKAAVVVAPGNSPGWYVATLELPAPPEPLETER